MFLPMLGFEPQISGIWSGQYDDLAATTASNLLTIYKTTFYQWGSVSCRWRYWSWMIAWSAFHFSKKFDQLKIRHLSSGICAAIYSDIVFTYG